MYFNIKIPKLNYGAHKKYGARKFMVHIKKNKKKIKKLPHITTTISINLNLLMILEAHAPRSEK